MEFDFSSIIHDFLEWTEKHAGLGGWVGAAGAIAAIFVTWGIARAEYFRTRRQARLRRREEIRFLRTIIYDFELLFQTYAEAALAGNPSAVNFQQRHMNDAEQHAMVDLAHIPVTEWPSLNAYIAFKRYWYFAITALNLSQHETIDKDALRSQLSEHDIWLRRLREGLQT